MAKTKAFKITQNNQYIQNINLYAGEKPNAKITITEIEMI